MEYKRDLYKNKRDLHVNKRDLRLYLRQQEYTRAVHTQNGEQKRPIYIQKRPIYIHKRPLHINTKHVWRERQDPKQHEYKRDLHVYTKDPCMNAQKITTRIHKKDPNIHKKSPICIYNSDPGVFLSGTVGIRSMEYKRDGNLCKRDLCVYTKET